MVRGTVLGRFERMLVERASTPREREPGYFGEDRTLQLVLALAEADRLRALLQDGFADRDRGFEYVLARFPNASPDRERAERAEAALAERTLQLAEALTLASVRVDALVEGLADRDLRVAAIDALSEKRLRSDALRQEELRAENRRLEVLLEARSVQLAESLIAAERTRATILEILRLSGESLALLRARLASERRAAIKPPNLVRRVVRALRRRVSRR